MWPLLCGICALVIGVPSPLPQKGPKPAPPKAAAKPAAARLRGTDVMATVEGQKITRADLTYFWLQTDTRIAGLLGDLLASRWKADRGASETYQVTLNELYAQLYGGGATNYAPTLSALVSQRLVDILATRKGIIVTKTQEEARAHEIFEQVRQQNNLKLTDDEIMRTYRVPRDILFKDMTFHIQVERLLAADISERNGHSIGAEDWAEVRELFAGVSTDGDTVETEQRFAEAKERLQGWLKELGEGKSFTEIARAHNENFTRGAGGLRGPALRGTGTPALEAAIYRLKPGEMTEPLRAANGWYVFKLERKGAQITEEERGHGWKIVLEAKRNLFLSQLRKKAKVTSVVPLPADTPPPISANPAAAGPDTPPAPPAPGQKTL